jgi:hypothetical protein
MTAPPLAPAYRAWREALAAYNDPTFPDSEENAREQAYHHAYDSMMDADILTDDDAEAAAALAIDLLKDGQDQECADVLEEVREYFANKR